MGCPASALFRPSCVPSSCTSPTRQRPRKRKRGSRPPSKTTAVRRLFLAALLALPFVPAARAEYPERPIRMIVPFPPGGVTDVVARVTAERLTAELGPQVSVENKAGAGRVIG